MIKGIFDAWLVHGNDGWAWAVRTPDFDINWVNPSKDMDACMADARGTCGRLGVEIVETFYRDWTVPMKNRRKKQEAVCKEIKEAVKQLSADYVEKVEAPLAFFADGSDEKL